MASEKISLHTGKIIKAIQETPDTWTLYIDAPNKNYLAGQFLNIAPHQFPEIQNFVHYLEHMKEKKELVRAYSLASAPHEEYVAITVKPERYTAGETAYPPVLSPLLASNILVGRTIEFTGYTGAYIIKPEQTVDTNLILHICAGSGIVPNFSILKDELIQKKNLHIKHVLINVNKTQQDIIYQNELMSLAETYHDRFQLIHMLTREDNPQALGPYFKQGRPTKELIESFITDINQTMIYTCGAGITKWQRLEAKKQGTLPQPRFLETIQEIVLSLGLDKKRFKHEAYG